MSNWESEFYIGDRVTVEATQLRYNPLTGENNVTPVERHGEIFTIDLSGNAIGIRFDDGEERHFPLNQVRKWVK